MVKHMKIIRGEQFERTIDISIESHWSNEGGMGEETFCENLPDVKEALKRLEEIKSKHKYQDIFIAIRIMDTEPVTTEKIEEIKS
jgi:hypothetical protein